MSHRLEVISKLSQTNPPSKRSIARKYEVSEATIRKAWAKREVIHKRSALMSEETKKNFLEQWFSTWGSFAIFVGVTRASDKNIHDYV